MCNRWFRSGKCLLVHTCECTAHAPVRRRAELSYALDAEYLSMAEHRCQTCSCSTGIAQKHSLGAHRCLWTTVIGIFGHPPCTLSRTRIIEDCVSQLALYLQRQLEEEARAKQFRARQFNPALFAGVQPRARRSETGRNNGSGVRVSLSGGRHMTAPKTGGSRPDQRHSYRQEILEGEFSNEATVARRAMVLAREVCCTP